MKSKFATMFAFLLLAPATCYGAMSLMKCDMNLTTGDSVGMVLYAKDDLMKYRQLSTANGNSEKNGRLENITLVAVIPKSNKFYDNVLIVKAYNDLAFTKGDSVKQAVAAENGSEVVRLSGNVQVRTAGSDPAGFCEPSIFERGGDTVNRYKLLTGQANVPLSDYMKYHLLENPQEAATNINTQKLLRDFHFSYRKTKSQSGDPECKRTDSSDKFPENPRFSNRKLYNIGYLDGAVSRNRSDGLTEKDPPILAWPLFGAPAFAAQPAIAQVQHFRFDLDLGRHDKFICIKFTLTDPQLIKAIRMIDTRDGRRAYNYLFE